jgi:hypothetical protein
MHGRLHVKQPRITRQMRQPSLLSVMLNYRLRLSRLQAQLRLCYAALAQPPSASRQVSTSTDTCAHVSNVLTVCTQHTNTYHHTTPLCAPPPPLPVRIKAAKHSAVHNTKLQPATTASQHSAGQLACKDRPLGVL